MRMTIFRYKFEDGTLLRLLDKGLSNGELWELEKIHGKCTYSGIEGDRGEE